MADPKSESASDQDESTPTSLETVPPQEPAVAIAPDHRNRIKLADHPHWWTILLSAIAIAISVMGYVESHRTRALNEEVNRPIVRVVSIVDRGPVLGKMPADQPRRANAVDLHIRNSGKTFAGKVLVAYKAQLDDLREGKGYLRFSDDKDAAAGTELVGDLAPDEEYSLVLWVSELQQSPKIDIGNGFVNTVSLYIKGNVTYTSPTNGASHTEKFCFYEAGMYGQFIRCPLPDQTK
jgi:hypothetical protein